MKKSKAYSAMLLLCAMVIILSSCTGHTDKPDKNDVSVNIVKPVETEPIPDISNQKGLLAITNCNIIDGTGSNLFKNGYILIKDGRIEKVGTAKNITVPESYQEIDLKGCTVFPGLINAHVHSAYNEATLQRWLSSGITTVRDLAPWDKSGFIDKQNNFNKNLNNARIVSATPIISPPGGYYAGCYVESPEDARKKVLDFIERGADIIKTSVEDDCQGRRWPIISKEVLRSIVDTAHLKSRKVSAHITHTRNLQTAVDAGIDDIAHMVVEPIDEQLVNNIIKKNIYWVPTLELWNGVSKIHSLDYDRVAVENLSRFYKAGGKIALGTDYSGYSFKFDDELPVTEISLMKKAGMSNLDIITAATGNAAYVCGLDKELGTLEKGKIADILVVKDNPLDQIEALQKPHMVIHGGKIVYFNGKQF